MPKIIVIASHKGTCDERDAFCMLIGDDVSVSIPIIHSKFSGIGLHR